MKKMIFSAAAFGLVAATGIALAPTNAEAIPAFARQTGAACLSCHFQEVPALTAFGRAFKKGSFTDVGDEALVEDDNLSIPAVLNATMVVRMNVTHTSGGVNTAGTAAAPSSTTYGIPVDTNFLVAGRIGSHTGAFVEFGGGAGDTGQAANNIQLMNSWDISGFKVGLGWADTSFGGDAVMNVSNVYGQHSGAVGNLGGSVGAINHSGFTNSTSAIGAWIGNDLGYVQFALVAPGGGAGWLVTGTAPAASATQNQNGPFVNVGTQMGKLIRVAATLDIAGWDTLIGGGIVTGKVGKGVAGATTGFSTPNDMNLDFVDVQLQGAVGDMSLGVYGDWAHAKGTTNGNLYGAQDLPAAAQPAGTTAAALGIASALSSSQKFDAYSIRATLEPVSRISVGLGYGSRKTTGTAGTDQPTHKVFAITASYQLYQNSIISLNYTSDKTSGFVTLPTVNNNTVHTTTLDWLTLM
jgi:hypothetical protein